MKVCVYGAGAVGCALGVGLARVGCAVSVVARGTTAEAIRTRGLLADFGQGAQKVAVAVSEDPTELGVQDLLVVAVKAPSLRAVAAAAGPLVGPGTTILPAMNGVPWWFFDGIGGPYQGATLPSVDGDRALAAALPPSQVVGCVVHFAASTVEPGWARVNSPQRPLIIGESSCGSSDRLGALAKLLGEAGFDTKVSQRIHEDVWYKLWGNMTMNPLSALTGATTDRLIDDPLVRRFCLDIMDEAKRVGERIGCPITQSGEERIALTRTLGGIKTSMLQDAEAGKALELDALVGAVREIGELVGLPTPATDVLFGLVRLQGRLRGLYPDR